MFKAPNYIKKYVLYNGTMTHIYRGVYIGDWASSVDVQALVKNGIKKINL